MISDPTSKIGDSEAISTLLIEIWELDDEVVTISMWPGSRVGILVPAGRDLRVCGERGKGQKW